MNEADIKSMNEKLEFKDFLDEDPRTSLKKSGIYDFIKKS